MAARLTDRQKGKIIADYLENGSYNATAKINGVSKDTVRRIVQNCDDFAEKAQQKKEQNTADVLEYMERQKKDVCEVLSVCMNELKKAEKYAKVQPQQIATTMAILIDKYTAFGGVPVDSAKEDDLSQSLRELGKELESDP